MSQVAYNTKKTAWSRQQWLAVGILLLGFLLVVTSVTENSVTMDEPVHALTGYSIMKTGDLRLVEDHPPFLEMLMGYPLSLDYQLPEPGELTGWDLRERRTFGNDSIWMSPPIDRWLIPARIPITFFAVILCALVFRWVTDIAGSQAGLICAALIACDSNIIAHAGLATLDVGVTTLSFSALFVLFRLLKSPSTRKVSCGGLLVGLALASKISALPLLLIAGIWMLVHICTRQWSLKEGMKWGAVYVGIALLTVWAVHLFQVEWSQFFPWLIPAPSFWNSIIRITQHIVTENRFSFLLGRTYRGGVWTYFPVTFLLKTPEAVLILFFVAILGLQKTWQRQKRNLLFLCLYPLIYLTVSLSGALNLGYRHLLPVVPYIYMLLGINLATLVKIKWLKVAYYAAVIWQISTAILSWPYYIPYFNLFAGGTSKGYQYLADSSVDWGQALIAVHDYVNTHKLESPKISAFTSFVDPSESYGIDAELLPPHREASVPPVLPQRYNPKPGDYIISASTLRGLQVADQEMYNWFWYRKPQAVIGGAMLHYRVHPADTAPTWVAQCSTPVSPLSNDDIRERFGIDNLRTVTFDCVQSWFYPDGGRYPGWYVIHTDVINEESIFQKQMLAGSKQTFLQSTQRDTPTHAVYTATTSIEFPEYKGNLLVSPSEWHIIQVINLDLTISLPINFGNVLLLTAFEVKENNQSFELWTQWRVEANVEFPISLMAHLIDTDNQTHHVGDSFGIPYTMLQPGDVFVQRHILKNDVPRVEALWIQTGVYRLDTVERYPVLDGVGMGIVGDRILVKVSE